MTLYDTDFIRVEHIAKFYSKNMANVIELFCLGVQHCFIFLVGLCAETGAGIVMEFPIIVIDQNI